MASPRNTMLQYVSLAVAAAWPLTQGACNTGVNAPGPALRGTVSFAEDIQPIFNSRCIECHSLGGFADYSGIALTLVEGASYGNLVNRASSMRSDLTLVLPGDSSASLLYLKVSLNSPPSGETMPLLGDRLTSEELALVRDWIDQGALAN